MILQKKNITNKLEFYDTWNWNADIYKDSISAKEEKNLQS